ncbi:MAG: hypothetical protein AB8G05_13265 [Oligoflexales bacterium]
MIKVFLYLCIAMLHLSSNSGLARKSNQYSKLTNHWQDPGFDISKAVSKEDWSFFMQSAITWKKQFWHYHWNRGKSLGDWSWTWRSGWLQVCSQESKKWCTQILQAALFDKALVIRAKAAQVWGRLYSGTGNPAIGGMLEKAYQMKENNRNGKPLFIKKRILFALKSIGGDKNLITGRNLASSNVQMLDYWQRLAKPNG